MGSRHAQPDGRHPHHEARAQALCLQQSLGPPRAATVPRPLRPAGAHATCRSRRIPRPRPHRSRRRHEPHWITTMLLTSLADVQKTKLAGGDIRLPTFPRPTRGGSANVDSSSAISRSSTARCLRSSRNDFRRARRLHMHWATYRDALRLWGFRVCVVEPILIGGARSASIDHRTSLLRFTSIATAVVA